MPGEIENPRKLSQDSWSPSRDLIPGLSEYEAGILTNIQRFLMYVFCEYNIMEH
jgi:hypothetical protein